MKYCSNCILSPLEKVKYMTHENFCVHEQIIENNDDEIFKPGLLKMIIAFFCS